MPKPTNDARMVHWLVKKTAEELAGEYYEYAASNKKHGDAFYKAFPNQRKFIKKEWRSFIAATKDIMTTIMSNPMTPEGQRQEIYHALVLDATLPYCNVETQVVNWH